MQRWRLIQAAYRWASKVHLPRISLRLLGFHSDRLLMSISPCPGDFRTDLLGNCLQEVATADTFDWTTNLRFIIKM